MDLINGFDRASPGFWFGSANRVLQGSGVATTMMGAIINLDFISLNADKKESSNSNLTSFFSNLHNGLEIFLEVFDKSYVKSIMSQKTSNPFN